MLKLAYNLEILLLKIPRATGEEIAVHLKRPAKVISASCVRAR
jgi:hypothetical protein